MPRKNKLFLFSIEEINTPWGYNFSHHLNNDCELLSSTVHWHDYFEFEIVSSGSGTHILNDHSYTISRGSAYLLTPFDFHTIHPTEESYPCVYNFNFSETALPQEIISLLPVLSSSKCQFDENEMTEIVSEIEFLEKISQTEDSPLKTQLLTCSFSKIIIMFLQKCGADSSNPKSDCKSDAFHKAVALVRNHFREQLTLNSLAKAVGLTPNYLGQLFIKQYGVAFNDFLKKIRLKHAKNLLKHSDYSICEIGKHSGFKTTSYFIQCFKEEFSTTPKQYMLTKNLH